MKSLPVSQLVFAVFVLFVFATAGVEIVVEFGNGETLDTMVDDMAHLAISGLVIIAFLYERHVRQRELKDLRHQLTRARGKLAEVDSRSQQLASEYREVMQKQFDAWTLSASEQDVVIGMLKGLSFREIAELRETQEKTVRQQASSVYRKARVSGRNELVAWFFEDMLAPPPLRDPEKASG